MACKLRLQAVDRDGDGDGHDHHENVRGHDCSRGHARVDHGRACDRS